MKYTKGTQKVHKSTKSVPPNGTLSQLYQDNLTPAERDILILISEPNFFTVSQIAIKRGTKDSIVYRHIRNLRKKGYLSPTNYKVQKMGTTQTPKSVPQNIIRLHGEQFHFRILWCDKRYKQILEGSNRIELDGNTVMLYRNTIEVYASDSLSFYGLNPDAADAKAVRYWNRFIGSLENRLKILLKKPGVNNMERVAAQWSRTNDDMAIYCLNRHQLIRCTATEDGKTWLVYDNSFNLKEAETIHPKTGKHDMGNIINPIMNDYRDNPEKVILPSKITDLLLDTNKQVNEIAHGLKAITVFLASQIPKDKKEGPKQPLEPAQYIG